MTERRNRRTGSFGRGMLIYALIVLALLPALLRPLWNYLAAYEQSGPDRAMERYLESMDEAHIRAVAADDIAALPQRYQTAEQALEAVKELMRGELRYALRSADTDLRHASYSIRSGGQTLGSVSIAKGEDPRFGFAPWEVEAEDFDFSFLRGDDEITVPEDWTVLCNGVTLGAEERTADAVPYDILGPLYGDSRFALPVQVTYRVTDVLGEAPFTLLDSEGQEQPRHAERTEFELLANCGEAEQERIKSLLDAFLQRYIDCLSNASRNVRANYDALKPYILSGSDIDKRVKDNMEGQQWAHSGGDTVTARDDLLLMDLGNGYYLAALDYTLDTVGNRGHVESVNRVLVLMSETNDGLKVIEVYSL